MFIPGPTVEPRLDSSTLRLLLISFLIISESDDSVLRFTLRCGDRLS